MKDTGERWRETCAALVREHYRPIYGFLAHLTGDASLAEDLTQETFAAAWAHLDQLRDRSALGLWLRQIARRKFVDCGRRRQRRAALAAEMSRSRPDAPASPGPLGRLLADERSRRLYEATAGLAAPQHLVIVLHYIQGLSFREMAEVLGEPVGTVKWRTSRALKQLRASLNGKV